ncbi:MAG: T9SS type A sorting domain-containing protein [Muribaculaceae bacterium]|nr:T9SS type A sorting domain-containing protein [Muribaculaceae bacterium]MBQ6649561.1 T9SS type A sorting domain-containing protein [Muribaculaceae bacterium]
MVKRRFFVILAALMMLAAPLTMSARAQWRETTQVQGRSLTDPKATDGVEIFQRSGTITIRTQRTIQVRVFTILGQLVSQATLQPGIAELKLNTRGIYLVKIGNITQKVAL